MKEEKVLKLPRNPTHNNKYNAWLEEINSSFGWIARKKPRKNVATVFSITKPSNLDWVYKANFLETCILSKAPGIAPLIINKEDLWFAKKPNINPSSTFS